MTLLIGAIPGILVAFVLSLLNIAQRASNPAIDVLAANDTPSASLLADAPAGRTRAPTSAGGSPDALPVWLQKGNAGIQAV